MIGGLFSGVACQTHMVAWAGAAPAGPSHHGTHTDAHDQRAGTPSHDGSAPEDRCCIVQVADSKPLSPTVLQPEAIATTVVATIEALALRLPDPQQAVTHWPPGISDLLGQTCVLLI